MGIIGWQSGAAPSVLNSPAAEDPAIRLGDVSGQNSIGSAQQAYSNALQSPLGGYDPSSPSGTDLANPVYYGGYAGGASDTAAYLASLQQQAMAQRAPQANYGQANAYMGAAGQAGQDQGYNLAAMRSQITGLEREASGQGTTAADQALTQGIASGQAAQRSLASSAAPGAAWSGAQREAAGGQSLATAQGAAAMTQQKYQEQLNAQAQLQAAQQGYQGALAGARGNALAGAQTYAGMEQFNPALAQQQQFLAGNQQGALEGQLLNLNTTVQGANIQEMENEMNYGLAQQGQQMQQSALTNSAIMGGAGGGLSALGSAISSNQQPPNPYA